MQHKRFLILSAPWLALSLAAVLMSAAAAWAFASPPCTSKIIINEMDGSVSADCSGECNLLGQTYDCIKNGDADPNDPPPIGQKGTVSCICYMTSESKTCDLNITWEVVEGENGPEIQYSYSCPSAPCDPTPGNCTQVSSPPPGDTVITCGCV